MFQPISSFFRNGSGSWKGWMGPPALQQHDVGQTDLSQRTDLGKKASSCFPFIKWTAHLDVLSCGNTWVEVAIHLFWGCWRKPQNSKICFTVTVKIHRYMLACICIYPPVFITHVHRHTHYTQLLNLFSTFQGRQFIFHEIQS